MNKLLINRMVLLNFLRGKLNRQSKHLTIFFKCKNYKLFSLKTFIFKDFKKINLGKVTIKNELYLFIIKRNSHQRISFFYLFD